MNSYLIVALVVGGTYFLITKKVGLSLLAAVLWPVWIFFIIASLYWGIGKWL